MKTSIFIKTCLKDLEWLSYSLRSIRKFCRGFHEVVIVADDDCKGVIEPMLHAERLTFTTPNCRGYIYQQQVKFRCMKYLDNPDCVLFVDSDCVFFDETKPENFLRDGLPVLLKTKYWQLDGAIGSVAQKWRFITQRFVGFSVTHEYMRRIPIVFTSKTIVEFNEAYNQKIDDLSMLNTNDFSEFNCLGAYSERFNPLLYSIVDTVDSPEIIPRSTCVQYWSWGGISPEIKSEMESFLQ